MTSNRTFLVREALDLLRQVRAELANDSNCSWVVEVDEAIVKRVLSGGMLDLYLHEGVDDPGVVADILKVLAQGLGTLLTLHRLFKSDQ
jgi:hypothetical protein